MRCNIHLCSWLNNGELRESDILKHDLDAIMSNLDSIKVKFDYPLGKPVTFDCDGPITYRKFITFVAQSYAHIYGVENDTSQVRESRVPGMLNRNQTNGKYEIWGHDMSDLYLEGAKIRNDHCELLIGS